MHAFHLVEDKTYLEIAGVWFETDVCRARIYGQTFFSRIRALAACEPELVITGDTHYLLR